MSKTVAFDENAEIVNNLINRIHDLNVEVYDGWDGDYIPPEKRFTLYPNMIAEMNEQCTQICLYTNVLRVSPRLFCAVIENGEKLTFDELIRWYQMFEYRLDYFVTSQPLSYIYSPALFVVDGAEYEGQMRMKALQAMVEKSQNLLKIDFLHDDMTQRIVEHYRKENEIQNAIKVIESLSGKEKVTQAAYNHAKFHMNLIIQAVSRAVRKSKVRDISS